MFEVKSLKNINDDLTGLLSKQGFLSRAQELINEDQKRKLANEEALRL